MHMLMPVLCAVLNVCACVMSGRAVLQLCMPFFTDALFLRRCRFVLKFLRISSNFSFPFVSTQYSFVHSHSSSLVPHSASGSKQAVQWQIKIARARTTTLQRYLAHRRLHRPPPSVHLPSRPQPLQFGPLLSALRRLKSPRVALLQWRWPR